MKKIKRVIDNILNRFGYHKVDIPDGPALTESDVVELFKMYGENEVFRRYLRDLCANDIRMYFRANNDEERNMIRGMHYRTKYFLALIKKVNEQRVGKGNPKDKGETKVLSRKT